MHTKSLAFVLLLSMFGMLFSACDDNTDNFGSGVMPGTDEPEVSQSLFSVNTRSVSLGAIIANTSECYLGRVTDPETSSTTTCNFLAQFYTLENYKLPPISQMKKDKGQVVADSVELRLYIKSFYGDSLNSMKIGIYELDANNVLDESATYYTDIDAEQYVNKQAGAVSKQVTFAVSDLSVADSLRYSSNYNKSIRVVLPADYGSRILQKYYQHPEYFKDAYAFTRNVVPGFYFKTLAGNGTLVDIDVTTLSIYFTYTQDDSTYVGIQRVAATEEVIQSNQVENENLDALVNSPDYTMLKTPAGIVTEVTLPIEAIYSGHDNDSVNSAQLVFKRQNNDEKTKYSLETPDYILMVRVGEMNEFFAKHKLPDSKTSYSAPYSSEYNSYTFSNLANMVSVLKNERDNGAGVKATDNQSLRTQKQKAWEKDHPDWNKVYLVPIEVVTNGQGTITSVHNQFGLTSTKLVGGPDNPLQISIVYSHFK